jgi:acyl-CoA synthetase (AMP-forming)/AMP-acid ligase II
MLVTVLDQADHRIAAENETHRSRLQSAGREVDIAHLRLVDEDGESVPTGEIGEIVVKGPHATPGYWNRPDADEETFSEGWLHTGDMARLDEDGYLYIMDRKKDMIITGGMNVFPREIEEVIVEHGSVSNAAVIGVPDDYWGEKVTALVEPRPDAAIDDERLAEQVHEHCDGSLAAYKVPKTVEIVGELPRNSYGKVLKTELRAEYWDDTDRNVN